MSSERPLEVPRDRHYDRDTHLWAHRDPATGRVRVGIDAIGLRSLGQLAYVALQPEEASVARGASLGSLEAAKMTATIAAPITGRIVARNEQVLRDPTLVNREPHDAGWLVELEPAMWEADAAELVCGEDLDDWVAAEIARLEAEDATT